MGTLIICQMFSSCFSFRLSPKKFQETFKNQAIKPTEHDFEQKPNRNIHYTTLITGNKPLLVFVHGSPGSWSAWEDFFKDSTLFNHFNLLAVDRPGFGYSGLGKAEKSLEKQALLLKPILQKHLPNNQKAILIGHSLGGPLIGRMAMDYPHLIKGLVFVAASNDPQLEPPRWYRYIGDSFLIRYFLPKSFRASNREILYLKPELEKMLPLWENITCPVAIIHGEKESISTIWQCGLYQK